MDNEFEADLITLCDESGKESEFEILDIIYRNDEKFFVLQPRFSDASEAVNSSGDYFIFKAEQTDGFDQLAPVEDDKTLFDVSKLFEDKYYSELYDEER